MNPEAVWRGLVLAWSLFAAAGASLTFIMLRASIADEQGIKTSGRNGELALLARRVIRGTAGRLVMLVAHLLASGTLWVMPDPARNLADLVVRFGFTIVFGLSAVVLFVLALRDLLDTLHLLERKPLPLKHEVNHGG
jgi:hypothetical protein